MTDTKWFVSYRTYSHSPMIARQEDVIITDVTPARWLMYHHMVDKKCVILYAEEISPSLAAELVHAAGIKAYYFKEIE